MTANERLIDLLAVYMSNKVLLPGCNSSKISSGGEGGESDEGEKTQMRYKVTSTLLHEDTQFTSHLGVDVSSRIPHRHYGLL